MIVARDTGPRQAFPGTPGRGRAACRPVYEATTAIYYAGPAKTPAGYASGSFGPTTAGAHGLLRADQFQAAGGSFCHAGQGQPLIRSRNVDSLPRAMADFTSATIGGPGARASAAGHASRQVELRRVSPNSAWRRCGGSPCATSPPSSSSTTRATTSTPASDPRRLAGWGAPGRRWRGASGCRIGRTITSPADLDAAVMRYFAWRVCHRPLSRSLQSPQPTASDGNAWGVGAHQRLAGARRLLGGGQCG